MKSRKDIMEIVLRAPNLLRTIESLAQEGKVNEKTLWEKAGKYLLEIASDYNGRWIGVWEKVLSLLWKAIYDDFVIDQAGMATIREISQKMPFVIIPCHRSHLDYLILSYLFRKHDIPLPFVAAGDNMDFWPLGYIFRQSGAFFLRRSFQGDDLYAAVFATYLETLVKEGLPIEFFMEGGRSRTGKMLMPRYGMLAMIIRAYQNKEIGDLALIPISIGYDRVIEENSYRNELQGVPKRRESTLDVVKHVKIIIHSYGRVYVNIGTPVFLNAYFASQPRPFGEMSSDDQQALYRDVGCRMVSEINRVSVVTPFSLVAASLVCHAGKEIPGELLMATFAQFYDYLRHREVNFASTLTRGKEAVPPVLELFQQWGYLSRQTEGEDKQGNFASYLIPEGRRLNLEYYKNTVIHHFLPVCLAALSILSWRDKGINFSRIRDDCLFLKKLFRHEFIFEGDGDRQIEATLSYLEEIGVIHRAEGQEAWKTEAPKDKLIFFAGLLRSYLESYWMVLNAFSPDEKELTGGKNLTNYLWRQAKNMYEKGDVLRPESFSLENYKNALKVLQEEDILSSESFREEEIGKKEGAALYVDRNRLENLRLRLSNFMEVRI